MQKYPIIKASDTIHVSGTGCIELLNQTSSYNRLNAPDQDGYNYQMRFTMVHLSTSSSFHFLPFFAPDPTPVVPGGVFLSSSGFELA
jgi:hypothetical protein